MPQLGSGNGTGYSDAIDTRQAWQNSPAAMPDSAMRLDAEGFNDFAAAIVAIETVLGARPQGVFASLAARLQQFLPGGGTSPLLFSFAAATSVTVLGTQHHLGAATLLFQAYDANTPRAAIQPSQVTINVLTYDVIMTFATAQSGTLALANAVPQYTAAFTGQTTVTILGAAHLLGTGALLVRAYTTTGTLNFLQPATITVHQSTQDVVVTFGSAQTGSILLSAAGPRHVATFTGQTTVTILGSAHNLGSSALLFQVYSAAVPAAVIEPNTFTVHPSTYDVVLTFGSAQSGFVVLAKAPQVSGTDFQIRDGGMTDSTATRVYSDGGALNLQMGSGDALRIRNKQGTERVTVTDAGRVGIGTTAPAYQLQLTGDAAKPTSTWTVPSDIRLKEVLRPFTDGLAVLLQFEAVWFQYVGLGGMPDDRIDKRERIGQVAQDVQGIAPYLVRPMPGRLTPEADETPLLAYDGDAMIFILMNAIKELAGTVATLTTRLTQLETRFPQAEEPA